MEIFVVQTEGRKKWCLYAPLGGFELPSTPSNDLSEDVIGEPTMEVTLEVLPATCRGLLINSLPAAHIPFCPPQTKSATKLDATCLQVGDVLYLPRGTIHAAITDNESASCHVTVSTYQQFSFATLAQHVLETLVEGQTPEACLPIELRRGLPMGFLYQHGLQHDAGVPQRGEGPEGATGPNHSLHKS